MTPEEWEETARSHCFPSPKALLIHWYYTIGLQLHYIVERLGVSRREVVTKMLEYKLPLREEDKLK